MVLSLVTAVEAVSPWQQPFRREPSRRPSAGAVSRPMMAFDESLHRHCAKIAATLPVACGLRLTCATVPVRLPWAVATCLTAIALELVNEAVTVLQGGRGGRIGVSFRPVARGWELVVEHSGPCMLAVCGRGSVDARPIRVLVDRLGGRLERARLIGGVRSVVTVPCS
jgi:hypothetical protein